jgi:sugar fermentation stimulation protein A
VLLLRLKAARRLKVGRLGVLRLRPGWYTYVGSAQRNLLARLRRHARRRKALHWHIDRLTQVATVVGAWLVPAPKCGECRLAAALARGGEVVAGFGASDCRCRGHLIRFVRRSEVEEAVGSAARKGERSKEIAGESAVPCSPYAFLLLRRPACWRAGGGGVRILGKRELTALGAAL